MKKFLLLLSLTAASTGLFSQAARVVLYEEFSGENCGPCAAVNPYVNALVDQYPNNVILLKYQVNIPSAGPIYYQNTSQSNSRRSYYGCNSAPWGEQDGTKWDAAEDNHPASWVNDPSYLDNRSAVPSPFTITANHQISADADSFYLTVNIAGASAFTASASNKLKLQVVMVEDLSFATPPGSNGETEFHHVMRKMYPSQTGTVLANSWTATSTDTRNFSGLFPSYIYDKSKVRFIVFIQDDGNKEVQQAAISDAQFLVTDAISYEVTQSFYSCSGSITPSAVLKNNGTQTLATANLDVYVDNVLSYTYPWAGSLATGASATVPLTTISGLSQGNHIVKVVTSNPNSTTDLQTRNDTAKADFTITATPTAAPLVEGFESGSAGWAVENSDAGSTWSSSNTGSGSATSFVVDFYNSPNAAIDNLYAPRLNLLGYSDARITFDRAHAQYSTSADKLQIEVSTNCGSTWQSVYSKSGATLSTAAATTAAFVPTANQWVADSASLTSVANYADVVLRFKATSNYGNNAYIDNINIFQFGAVVSGIEEIAAQLISVYPNPATAVLNANIALDKTSEVSLNVFNMMGQKLISSTTVMNAGFNPTTINTNQLPQGSYTLQLTINGSSAVKKFSIVR